MLSKKAQKYFDKLVCGVPQYVVKVVKNGSVIYISHSVFKGGENNEAYDKNN